MKRWLKIFLVLAVILGWPSLWLLVSHVMAKRAVERYKAQLRAAGEKLTIDELLSTRIPADESASKLLDEATNYLSYNGFFNTNGLPHVRNFPPSMRMVAPGKAMIGWAQREIVSGFRGWMSTNSWEDLLQELKREARALELLRQLSAFSRIDTQQNLRKTMYVYGRRLQTMHQAGLLLSAATVYDLHQGDITSAVTNLHTALGLINAWNAEPDWRSQQYRFDNVAIAVGSQWELLQTTNLTDDELALLQRDWESMDFIRPMEHALEMERAEADVMFGNLRGSNDLSIMPSDAPVTLMDRLKKAGGGARNKASDAFWRISWSYDDELRVLQRYQAIIECVRQVESGGAFKDAFAERARKVPGIRSNDVSSNWLRSHLQEESGNLPIYMTRNVEYVIDGLLDIEAARSITVAAIALKRYQLRHGSWPADLKTLVPEFVSQMPRDPMDGLPLRYRRNEDGTFTLYSIGRNGTDDGGDPGSAASLRDLNWLRGHDWVWPQPATEEEIQDYYKSPPDPID